MNIIFPYKFALQKIKFIGGFLFMEITNITIFKTNLKEPVLARANVILSGTFIIRGITLIEGKNGRFISMPSRRLRNTDKKSYRDVCHPLNQEIRNELTEKIFEAYDEFIKAETEE